jgi:hypothetical protein
MKLCLRHIGPIHHLEPTKRETVANRKSTRIRIARGLARTAAFVFGWSLLGACGSRTDLDELYEPYEVAEAGMDKGSPDANLQMPDAALDAGHHPFPISTLPDAGSHPTGCSLAVPCPDAYSACIDGTCVHWVKIETFDGGPGWGDTQG